MNTNLETRIETMLSGRKIHTWGSRIGLTRGIIHNMNKGKLPNADKLGPIVRAENLSITWLLEGIGSPYLITHCPSGDDCCNYLDALYAEKWKTHLLVDGFDMAIVLTQPGSYDIDEISYLYTIVEVVTGPINRKTLELIGQQATDSNTFWVDTDVKAMRDLIKGNIGTYGLLHSADALLNRARPLLKSEVESFSREYEVAEENALYHGGGKVSPEEMATVQELRRLNPQNLTHIRAVIHSLADTADKNRTKDNNGK